MCLQAHYRSELEFSWEGLGAAQTRLKRLVMRVRNLLASAEYTQNLPAAPEAIADEVVRRLVQAASEQMSDDLNTPTCLTSVEAIAELNRGSAAENLGSPLHLDGILGLNFIGLTRFHLPIPPTP